jgi:hypothetical protein
LDHLKGEGQSGKIKNSKSKMDPEKRRMNINFD